MRRLLLPPSNFVSEQDLAFRFGSRKHAASGGRRAAKCIAVRRQKVRDILDYVSLLHIGCRKSYCLYPFSEHAEKAFLIQSTSKPFLAMLVSFVSTGNVRTDFRRLQTTYKSTSCYRKLNEKRLTPQPNESAGRSADIAIGPADAASPNFLIPIRVGR
jgi:signal recognition particle subunit SEC65